MKIFNFQFSIFNKFSSVPNFLLKAISYKLKANEGFSLFEILIAIAVFAVVGAATAQLISVALQSDKVAGEKTVATGLAREELEAVSAIAAEQWNNIFLLNKGSANHYHAVISSGKWATSTGDEIITANNLQYTKYFYAENICRDATTKNITGITDSNGTATACSGSGGSHDPSTQKATVVAAWQNIGGGALGTTTQSAFLTRARNTAATQESWAGGAGQADNPTSGETSNFNSNFNAQNNIDFSGGTLKLSP